MAKTLKERYILALTRRGESVVKETWKFTVMSRRDGGHYYIGRAGSLRIGRTIADSHPCTDSHKKALLDDFFDITDLEI